MDQEFVLKDLCELLHAYCELHVLFCGGLTLAGCQALAQLLSHFLSSTEGGEKKRMKKIIGQDKRREVP